MKTRSCGGVTAICDHRAQRRRRRLQAPDVQPDIAELQEIAITSSRPTESGGRRIRGLPGQRLDLRAVSADGACHADVADDPAASFSRLILVFPDRRSASSVPR
jgi:hypothetical protein